MSNHAPHQSYWVYILASKPHGTLYIGVTNSLERRTGWYDLQLDSSLRSE